MDVGRPKKKRSELELLLSNGDAGGLSSFSPRLPALSISSPALAEATAESDEQLARRLHEELNGTRMTRRGSKAVTEDGGVSLSPAARTTASPHGKSKAVETPRAHSGGPGRASLPSLPSISESAPAAGDAAASAAAEARTAEAGSGTAGPAAGTAAGGSGTGLGPGSALGSSTEVGADAAKRKRNSVPARELHLLLQQASSAAGRADGTFSPTRSARGGSLANHRADPSAASIDPQNSHQENNSPHQQGGGQSWPRRDADRSNGQQSHQHQPAGSSASAAVAPPPSPGARLPPPPPQLPPPSLLPPKLKQRYLAGLSSMNQPPPSSVSASGSNDGRRTESNAARGSVGTSTTATAVTPNCVLGGAGNTLLSGQTREGSSVVSQSQSQSQSLSPSRGRDRFGAGATYIPPDAAAAPAAGDAVAPAASLTAAGPRALAVIGASIGGCSSTDETENDNENSCAAAAAGTGDGGPSATSPKPSPALVLQLPPPLLPSGVALQDQHKAAQATGPAMEADLADEDLHSQPQGRAAQRQAAGGSAAAAAAQPTGQAKQAPAPALGHSLSGPLKVPKLPMIRAGRGWYRGRLMRESVDGQRVLVDVPGAPNPGSNGNSSSHQQQHQPFWLPVTSDRIWRGSYKGKDWKHLGDGAWEPKPTAFKRGKLGSSSNGLPLPLPPWAVGCSGPGAEAEAQQPSSAAAGCADGSGAGVATAEVHRSKRDRGDWSSPDETSDDMDPSEEQLQHQLQQVVAAAEGPSTRSGQRAQRRSPPAVTTVVSGRGAPAVTAAAAAAAAAVPSAGAAPGASGDAMSVEEEVETTDAGRVSEVTAGLPPYVDATDEPAEVRAAAAPEGPAAAAVVFEPSQRAPRQSADGNGAAAPVVGAARDSPDGASASASVDSGAVGGATATAAKAVHGKTDGSGSSGAELAAAEEGCDAGEITWEPGAAHPRKRIPRRARRRQQRVRTPFDGLQFPLSHHHPQPNPYAFYPVLSEESGGDGDASDAEHGAGRRGSGDGAAVPHHGSRRRAAARAAAVAAAAARAEAEAEEEEQEEILLGRRPPRRDRFYPHSQYGNGAAAAGTAGRRNFHSQHHHHRSRSGARADYYLYGDSSGNLDDPYSCDFATNGHWSSARPRAGSRGNSQPAPEYGSGGSGAWESVQWQTTVDNRVDGGTAQAPPAPPRNRRKGKPIRSRMDGEGDVWCCGEDEWELEAAGGAWARMPEVLRRLYYTPSCPGTGAADDSGGGKSAGGQQQQPRQQHGGTEAGQAFPHRQSGGGAYFGALHFTNSKRRRVYDEDPTVSPDDLDLEMEVDDHEHDADYLPPYGAGGGIRRSSGLGGGRRWSVNGGSAGTVTAKRQRSGEASNLQLHYQQHHSSALYRQQRILQYGDAAPTAIAKRRILVSYGSPGWGSRTMIDMAGGDTAATMGGAFPGVHAGRCGGGSGDGIPAGLAGLLEAALGHDAVDFVTTGGAAGGDVTRPGSDVKVEAELGPDAAAVTAVAAIGRLLGQGGDTATAPTSVLLPPPGDPHGAHVALSDSSAAPSGAEESKHSIGGGGGGATAAAVVAIDMGGPVACADGGPAAAAAAVLQQHRAGSSGGSGAGLLSGGSTSPPPPGVQMGQLRPNTPTRARRTGRPPFAVLGTGAPLPKLPALSSTASLRLQTAVAAGPGGPAAAPASGCPSGTGAGSHLPALKCTGADAQNDGGSHVQELVDTRLASRPIVAPQCLSGGSGEQGGEDELPNRGGGRDAGSGGGGGWKEWQGICGGAKGAGAVVDTGPAQAGAAGVREMDTGEAGVMTYPGGSIFTAAAAVAAAAIPSGTDGTTLATKLFISPGAGTGTGCCVMDAIGALLYDKQPAMQQLAMRAQLELDSIGIMVSAQQQQQQQQYSTVQHQEVQLLQAPHHFLAAHHLQHQNHQHQLHQCLLSGRGGSSGLRSGCLSAAASPPASDPVISNLPSVDVVVSLFSARTPFGSAQQALADLVGGASALPLFR